MGADKAPSFYDSLFPPTRNREKEAEASAQFVPKSPPCLNTCAVGYKPNWITSNILLCPANWEYAIADAVSPILYSVGIDTPNKVTLMNCCTVRLFSIICFILAGDIAGGGKFLYWTMCFWFPMQQLTDGVDGQMARRYGLGSKFGAWLDHTTDNIYGGTIAIIFLYKVYVSNDTLFPVFVIAGVFGGFCFLGNNWIQAEERGTPFSKMNFFERTGMFLMLFLSYLYMIFITILMRAEWLK